MDNYPVQQYIAELPLATAVKWKIDLIIAIINIDPIKYFQIISAYAIFFIQ
jgi:hypothetical protein